MTDQKAVLQARLDQNYADYIAGFQGKAIEDLILFAPEITAAQQLREELADACDEDDIEFLLQFDDPLELVRGYWEGEITGYDHSGEMGHMLWEIREREPVPKKEITPPPQADKDHVVMEQQIHEQAQDSPGEVKKKKPFMQLSGRDSNILSLMYTASLLLHMAGMQDQNKEMIDRVTSCCEDYDKALNIICEYVDTELSGHSQPQKSAKKKGANAHER